MRSDRLPTREPGLPVRGSHGPEVGPEALRPDRWVVHTHVPAEVAARRLIEMVWPLGHDDFVEQHLEYGWTPLRNVVAAFGFRLGYGPRQLFSESCLIFVDQGLRRPAVHRWSDGRVRVGLADGAELLPNGTNYRRL